MNDLNPFTSAYKKLSDIDLVAIISKPNDYQLPAVEAAQAEIQHRRLLPEQIANLIEEIDSNNQREHIQRQKFAGIAQSFLDRILSKDRISKYINIITIFSGLAFVFLFIHDRATIYLITHYGTSDLLFIILLAWPYILLPLGIIFFGLRKKAGWLALNFTCTYYALQAFYYLKSDLSYRYYVSFGEVLLLAIIGLAFSFIATIICKKDIRAIFKISTKTMLISFSTAAILILLLVYGIIK